MRIISKSSLVKVWQRIERREVDRSLTDDLGLVVSREQLEESWWVGTGADERDANLKGGLARFNVHGSRGCESCQRGDDGEECGLHCVMIDCLRKGTRCRDVLKVMCSLKRI